MHGFKKRSRFPGVKGSREKSIIKNMLLMDIGLE